MQALKENPVPSLILVIGAIVGGIVVAVAALSGDTNPGGLTFETYFQTLIAGAVGLGVARGISNIGTDRTSE